jgi:hypothetical protein
MRFTRRIDDFRANDFEIRVGSSARETVNTRALNRINRIVKKMDIPGTTVHFGGSSQIISGKTLAEKTVLGAFPPERLKAFGLEPVNYAYHLALKPGSPQHTAYKRLFEAENIKVGNKIDTATHFLIFNPYKFSEFNTYGLMAPLHEISHAFSSEAGLQKRDVQDTFYRSWDSLNDALDSPGDVGAYNKALRDHIQGMAGFGLEEARAESGALSLMVRGGYARKINEAKSIEDIIGYTGLNTRF